MAEVTNNHQWVVMNPFMFGLPECRRREGGVYDKEICEMKLFFNRKILGTVKICKC